MIEAVIRKAHLIQPSLDASPGDETIDDLIGDVARGECIVLEGREAVMVLEIMPDALNCWIVGGDLREVVGLVPGAEALARAMNKPWGTFQIGRPGWGRLLRSLGYEWDGTMHRKAL